MSGLERAGVGARPYLHVFQGPFAIIDGERRNVPESCERLMVWLALRRTCVDRSVTAGVLWPAVPDRRAAGNLRSALWRLRGAGLELVDSNNTSLALRADVIVDAHVAADWAQRLIDGSAPDADVRMVPWFADAISLLPGWDDDWAILERERLRQRTLHAFEQLSRLLCHSARHAEAVRAATKVVAADPLRASAQYTLIQAHLAGGEINNARRVLNAYRTLHRRAFGVDPSAPPVGLFSPGDAHIAQPSSPPHVVSGHE
jgi:DNA-binding SARP family transcriptional activator